MSELANWKCHKIVKAGKIVSIPASSLCGGPITAEGTGGVGCVVGMPSSALARGVPSIGDYIVIYEDGYKSWSPAKAFEAGYTRL